MMPSNTIYVSQEGPANALALKKDCTQVVIAGRNVFKVFSIGENEFSEVCNLRVGKNLNLNFSSIDVAWSAIEENTLATAATNGAVVVWDLGRSGRSKQEHVFSDHKRTVNKVSFHHTEPSLLISGSQDGMMKCFDLRLKEVARTFLSNTESIRDVQFSPHHSHQFAAVSENGNVQVWDVRRHERCVAQFTAHSGPVFACDWHPAANWLATASRDKTIKVWDTSQAKPTVEHTIYTIASVGHVKWRPNKKFQISSCALVLDCAVHVWDVRRPHLPLATFAEHRDVTTAIAWLAALGDDCFLTTSRDCTLYRHQWSLAAHPVLWAPPAGVCVSARGEVAHALPAAPLPPQLQRPPPPAANADRHMPGLGRKQPTAGSLSSTAQASLERLFPTSAGSSLTRFATREPAHNHIIECARKYRHTGAPTHELAKHNAQVAREYERSMVALVWAVVAHTYGPGPGARGNQAAREARPPPPPPQPPQPQRTHQPDHSNVVEEESALSEEDSDEWTTGEFHINGVFGMPTHSIYIPPSKFAKMAGDNEPVWVSAATAHYVDEDAIDWTLPEEAFPIRSAHADALAHPHAHVEQQADQLHEDMGAVSLNPVPGVWGLQGGGGGGGGGGGAGAAGASPAGSASDPPPEPHHDPMLQSQMSTPSTAAESEPGYTECGEMRIFEDAWRKTGCGPRTPPFDIAPLLAKQLKQHADLGDVQTACTVMLVLQDFRSDLFPYIDEALQEHWLLGYMELLQRHKLWTEACMVVRCAWVPSVWQLSQQSTTISLCCGRCQRRLRPHQVCDHCTPRLHPSLCAVCQTVVRGLYMWCSGCSHGGHMKHMLDWIKEHPTCPTGCGHQCKYS